MRESLMLTYYKRIHHPILTLQGNREHPGNFQNKISKLSFQLSVQVYSLLAQTEGGLHYEITPQSTCLS